jgi:hypothetical protein
LFEKAYKNIQIVKSQIFVKYKMVEGKYKKRHGIAEKANFASKTCGKPLSVVILQTWL